MKNISDEDIARRVQKFQHCKIEKADLRRASVNRQQNSGGADVGSGGAIAGGVIS